MAASEGDDPGAVISMAWGTSFAVRKLAGGLQGALAGQGLSPKAGGSANVSSKEAGSELSLEYLQTRGRED